MANKPFEYRIINPLERPKSEDLNVAQGQSHYDVRQFAYEIFGHQDGFLGSSFAPVPTDPTPDNNVVLTAGVAFQYGNVESAIGGIVGLNDSYQPKAVNIDTYSVGVTDPPALLLFRRYDLIQIRAPADSERLVDSEATDIYNPSLNSFSSLFKDKTLTSSVSEFTPEYIAAGDTATAPLSYVTGNEVISFDWNTVPKPDPQAGYLPVAYIRRSYNQTAIDSADIEDARTLLKLPAMVGGTGQSAVGDAGSIAYSNGTELEYTRATLFGVPQTGHILVSDGASTPNWIAPAVASSLLISAGANTNPTWLTPGVEGDVVASNGTSWEAQSPSRHYASTITGGVYSNSTAAYTAIPGLSLTDIALRRGNVRIELQPAADVTTDYNARIQNTAGGRRCYILLSLTNGPLSIDRVFSYELDPNTTGSVALPSFTESLSTGGNWTVTAMARSGNAGDSTIYIQNCDLVVSQG